MLAGGPPRGVAAAPPPRAEVVGLGTRHAGEFLQTRDRLIQATDGRLYTLTDKKLPDAIALFTGESHSGEHMAEVLMNPKPPLRLRDIPKGWPEGRDLMHVIIGFLLLSGIELLTDVLRNFLDMFRM